MKSKLHIAGLFFILLLNYSCSNDDYEIPEVKNNNFKIRPQTSLKKGLNEEAIDSNLEIINTEVYNADGDPINPIPPRG